MNKQKKIVKKILNQIKNIKTTFIYKWFKKKTLRL